MKKLLIATVVAATCSLHLPSANALSTKHQRELAFGGSAIVGALLAGPVGYVVGAASGALMAEKIKQTEDANMALVANDIDRQVLANKYELLNDELKTAHKSLAEQEYALELAAQTPLFFATGSDQLSKGEQAKLDTTIAFLRENPDATVQLNGFADPRGTDGYNLVLSEYRALAVKHALTVAGISADRIITKGYGIKAPAQPNDIAAYAAERRVDIQFERSSSSDLVMQ